MKKILAICGSGRKGNTELALDGVLNALKEGATLMEGTDLTEKFEIEKLNLRKLSVAPCVACYRCAQERACVIEDDMEPIYKKFDEADIIIIASPMCFTSVSAQLKALIDRCQAIYVSKYQRGKSIIDVHKKRAGCFICTTGSKNPDFTGVLMVADQFFKAVNAAHVSNLLLDNTDDFPIRLRELKQQYAQTAQELLGHFKQ